MDVSGCQAADDIVNPRRRDTRTGLFNYHRADGCPLSSRGLQMVLLSQQTLAFLQLGDATKLVSLKASALVVRFLAMLLSVLLYCSCRQKCLPAHVSPTWTRS